MNNARMKGKTPRKGTDTIPQSVTKTPFISQVDQQSWESKKRIVTLKNMKEILVERKN